MKILSRIYVALIILFLYAPVAVMVIFSFNGSGSVWVMNGFSTRWYAGLTSDTAMMSALQHTLIIAVSSALISTVLGTAAAVGITAIRRKVSKKIIMSVTQIPMMNADIVTGISLMLLFIFIGKLLGLSESLGFLTVLISHITFNLPYVILSEFEADRLTVYIASGDAKALTAAAGVGIKLAQRIVLELKDKVGAIAEDGEDIKAIGNATAHTNSSEAVAALVSLGYSQGEASLAVGRLDQTLTAEELIKQALKSLARRI